MLKQPKTKPNKLITEMWYSELSAHLLLHECACDVLMLLVVLYVQW